VVGDSLVLDKTGIRDIDSLRQHSVVGVQERGKTVVVYMNRKRVLVGVLVGVLVMLVLIAGCTSAVELNTTQPHVQVVWRDGEWSKAVIAEDNITCYSRDRTTAFALSCMRDKVNDTVAGDG
jgi:hypothetical protein